MTFAAKIRTSILLLILVIVAADTYMTKYRSISWDETLWIAIYPINADNDPDVERYIQSLSDRDFDEVEQFFVRAMQPYGLKINEPFKVKLAHRVEEIPPMPPENRNMFNVMWWSLRLRWWAYWTDEADFSPHIKMFVVYHKYEQNKLLDHSLGLERGMIGVVHAFANYKAKSQNNVVLAHEILHTLGATDKYDMQTLQPVYPHGFAEPARDPRFPQRYAELMGGRIPVNQQQSVMPRALSSVLIGKQTAQEINWTEE